MSAIIQSNPISTVSYLHNSPAASLKTISYEKPLNERIRIFIQLEQLFRQFKDKTETITNLDKGAAINCLLDIISMLKTYNLKLEIVKEFENQISLSRKSNNSLELSLIQNIRSQFNTLNISTDVIKTISNITILNSTLLQNIALRRSIPGGSYGFLIPQYHYWLEQEESTCLNDLTHWNDLFKMHRLALQLILKVIRNRTSINDYIALDGFFQTDFNQKNTSQLIMVTVPKTLPYFHDISADKHRCNIRFIPLIHLQNAPQQGIENITFSLTY
jgi:cell division protein ZapD